MKAKVDLATMIGWNAEAFARTKSMKPLGKYLEPAPTPEQTREQGARDVMRMFDRMIAKQGKDG